MTKVGPWSQLRLSDGACEALKWIALAAMVVDHARIVMPATDNALTVAIGRLAMPMFCLVFGYNLARPGVDVQRICRRLLVVGLLAQPLAIGTINAGKVLPLNILLTFAAALGVVLAMREGKPGRAVLLLCVASLAVDYSFVGIGLLLASWYAWRRRNAVAAVALVGALVALNAWNGNAWAPLGFAAVIVATQVRVDVPRWPRAFLWAYPVHLAVLATLTLR